MSALRSFSRSCVVVLMGRKRRPRRILRGLGAGYKISVSPAENLSYLLGTAEPYLQRAIQDHVAAGDTVYDIGANIGYVSLSLAKRVGAKGQVEAFEPLPQNLEVLRKNIEINRLENVRVWDAAASDQAGEAMLRMAENPATASLVWHKKDPSVTEMAIRTVAVDDLVADGALGSPKFVKIDVEGAEGDVIKGMRRTVAAARPVIFIECSDSGREVTWKELQGLGYGCRSAATNEPVSSFDRYRHADFLWLPSD